METRSKQRTIPHNKSNGAYPGEQKDSSPAKEEVGLSADGSPPHAGPGGAGRGRRRGEERRRYSGRAPGSEGGGVCTARGAYKKELCWGRKDELYVGSLVQ